MRDDYIDALYMALYNERPVYVGEVRGRIHGGVYEYIQKMFAFNQNHRKFTKSLISNLFDLGEISDMSDNTEGIPADIVRMQRIFLMVADTVRDIQRGERTDVETLEVIADRHMRRMQSTDVLYVHSDICKAAMLCEMIHSRLCPIVYYDIATYDDVISRRDTDALVDYIIAEQEIFYEETVGFVIDYDKV